MAKCHITIEVELWDDHNIVKFKNFWLNLLHKILPNNLKKGQAVRISVFEGDSETPNKTYISGEVPEKGHSHHG